MVLLDGLHGGDAGQDALASAAEARHHVLGGRAQSNHLAAHRQRVHHHIGAPAGGAQINKVVGQAVVVHHPHPVIDRIGHQRAQLGLVAADVGAVGHQNDQIVGLDATLFLHILHQRRDHQILPHPEAAHVADDEGHRIAGLQPAAQGLFVDGRFQRGAQGGGDVFDGGLVVAAQLLVPGILRQIQLDPAASVGKIKAGHIFTFLSVGRPALWAAAARRAGAPDSIGSVQNGFSVSCTHQSRSGCSGAGWPGCGSPAR